MYRLAYRNFGDHESLVVNHSVTAGSSGGVRWYEIQNPNGTPAVAQQSTFAPDSKFRWMGSIAMDKAGDIAMGYSVSSSTTNPAIAFTGRVPTDPSSTMEAENTIINGTGSQTGTLTRWGDYSAITVDPVDDCTFWYTNEYLKASGTFNWSTRIANFKFPNCGNTTPDYSLSASPSSLSITQGTSGNSTITVTPINGFTGSVNLSAHRCDRQFRDKSDDFNQCSHPDRQQHGDNRNCDCYRDRNFRNDEPYNNDQLDCERTGAAKLLAFGFASELDCETGYQRKQHDYCHSEQRLHRIGYALRLRFAQRRDGKLRHESNNINQRSHIYGQQHSHSRHIYCDCNRNFWNAEPYNDHQPDDKLRRSAAVDRQSWV
jgi:hypothetical protein